MWKWFTRKLSQTQGLGSEISRFLGLFPTFLLNAETQPQEKVAAEFENHGEVSVEQSKYLGGGSLSNSKNCFSSCCLLQNPPPKKDTVPWILPIHFKTNFVLEFFEVDHFFPPLSIWGGFPWGDLEHTHLVKGLDFALLNKVRAELNKQKKVEEVQSLGSCVRFLFFLRPSAKGMGFYVFLACKFSPTKTSSDVPWPLRKVKQQQRSKAPGEKKSRTFEHRIVRMPGVSLIECFRFLRDSWRAWPGGIAILYMRGLNQETEQ